MATTSPIGGSTDKVLGKYDAGNYQKEKDAGELGYWVWPDGMKHSTPPPSSGAADPTPAQPNDAPAPAPPPTPQGMASPMASLQAAADPGAGWQKGATQSSLRPGLGARLPLPMQRLFPANPY